MASPKAFKILFVDNSRTMRAVMMAMFQEHGYNVTTIGTAPEALEKLKSEPFDAVVMDLYMPMMNGYEAAKIIRSSNAPYKDIPLLALSASEDPKDIDLCKSVGMNNFIRKTEDQKELFEILEGYRQAQTPEVRKP